MSDDVFRIYRDLPEGRVYCDNIGKRKWSKPNTKSVRRAWKKLSDAEENLKEIIKDFPDARIETQEPRQRIRPTENKPGTPAPVDIYTKEDYKEDPSLSRNGVHKKCINCKCRCKQAKDAIIYECPQFVE